MMTVAFKSRLAETINHQRYEREPMYAAQINKEWTANVERINRLYKPQPGLNCRGEGTTGDEI